MPEPDDAADPAGRPPWTIGQVLLGYLVAFVVSNFAVVAYASANDLDEATFGIVVVGLLSLWTCLFGTVIVLARNRITTDLGLRFAWSDLPVGAAIGLVSQIALVWLVYLPWRMLDDTLGKRLEEPARELTDLAAGPRLYILGVMIVVVTPFVEELFFRGLLQGALMRRFSPPAAIALSSLGFGLAHQQGLQLLGLVAFGLVLGYVAWRTGRLGLCIAAHAAFNLVTVLALAAERP